MVRNCRGAALKDDIFCGCDKHNQTLHQHTNYNMSEKCKDGDAPMPEVCFYSEENEADYLAAMHGKMILPDSAVMEDCMADCMDLRKSLSTDQSKYCRVMCTMRHTDVVQPPLANTDFCDTAAGVKRSCGECRTLLSDRFDPPRRVCVKPEDEPAAAPAEE